MPATISQINTAIATQLSTIDGLQGYDYEPDAVYPPIAFPSITNIDYHRAMGNGLVIYDITIRVIVGRVNERVGQDALDRYASYSGDESIRQVIESDRTLGGLVDTLILRSSASVSSAAVGEQDFLALDFQIQVYAR